MSGRLICTECQTPFHMLSYPPKKEGLCDICGADLYQRSGDKPEVVKNRLVTYKQETGPPFWNIFPPWEIYMKLMHRDLLRKLGVPLNNYWVDSRG
ncbi:MAG: hypothetical protein CM1200mP3_09520 [Chloroflexota bacterium]|nr:MAG: hypothetical protein CM1200mP3_09520 [Chloroflexota bacterium]